MKTKVELNPAVREQVDRMIADDYSDRSIVKALDSIGVKISQPTINRYRNSDQAQSTVEPEQDTQDAQDLPDDVVIKGDLGIDTGLVLDEFKTTEQPGLARERMLETIVNNQLAIVISEQRRFIAGECKYPFEGVKALKELLTLFDNTRLKISSQKEIDSILQDEKIERLAEWHYRKGVEHFKADIEVDPTNIQINTARLSALNLPGDKFKDAELKLEQAYLNGYRSFN
jgi:hypothetical protein